MGIQLLLSRAENIIVRKRAPGHHWIGSWLGPRAGLNVKEMRYILQFSTKSEVGSFVIQPAA
jgi:hypothetical protein